MKKLYKVTLKEPGTYKSTLVTAENETQALEIVKPLFFDAKEIEITIPDTLIRLEYFSAKEIKAPEKKYPYYVTLYQEYPIYESAEGGYYYAGTGIAESYGFQTHRAARKFIRKCYKECVKSGDTKDKYWYCNPNHLFFGMDSKYIGEGWFIQLERKQGASVRGWEPYC